MSCRSTTLARQLSVLTVVALFGSGVHANDRVLEYEVIINAPLAEVWDAFTTKNGIESWMVPVAEIDLRIGGTLKTSYDPDGAIGDANTIVHSILSYEPNRMISMQIIGCPSDFEYADLITQTWSVIDFEEVHSTRTRVRIASLGYGEGARWDEMQAFFEKGNAWTFEQLKKKFADTDGNTSGAAGVLETLNRLVGGEWIHESVREDGRVFHVRNVVTQGPDGQSIIGNGWQDRGSGMFFHANMQVWRDPETDSVRFQNIDERGSLVRGGIRLVGADHLRWDWSPASAQDKSPRYQVEMIFQGEESYRQVISVLDDDGKIQQLVNIEFRRVQQSPEALTKPVAKGN